MSLHTQGTMNSQIHRNKVEQWLLGAGGRGEWRIVAEWIQRFSLG